MHGGGWFSFLSSNDTKPRVTWSLLKTSLWVCQTLPAAHHKYAGLDIDHDWVEPSASIDFPGYDRPHPSGEKYQPPGVAGCLPFAHPYVCRRDQCLPAPPECLDR